jgi:hypothetical protein
MCLSEQLRIREELEGLQLGMLKCLFVFVVSTVAMNFDSLVVPGAQHLADIELPVVLGSCTLARISALVVGIAAPEFLVKKGHTYTGLRHRSRSNTDHLLYVVF